LRFKMFYQFRFMLAYRTP